MGDFLGVAKISNSFFFFGGGGLKILDILLGER